MGKIPTLACAGLMTDQNAIDAPPGALRLADDVLIEVDGAASPRPGFQTNTSKSTSRRPRRITWYSSAPIVASWDGSTTWQIESALSTISGEAEPLDYTKSFVQFAQSRKNLYWASKKGPYKITSSVDTTGDAAGMHEATSGALSIITSGTPNVLPNNNAIAYRWCFRKIDANDVETRSAPSPYYTHVNTTGGTVDIAATIPLPLYVAMGDQIEIYRSLVVPSTDTPFDQMYLSVRHIVTGSEVSAGVVTIIDRVAETDLGQELYTNATREGFLKENGRPPVCIAMAKWADCMWFGATKGPWTSSIQITSAAGAVTADGSTGLQNMKLTTSGATNVATNGNPTITNITAGTSSVKIGQLVSDGGLPGASAGTIPYPAHVLSKTATTVTLDVNCNASGPIDIRFFDGITVGSITYWAADLVGTIDATNKKFGVTTGAKDCATSLAYAISIYSTSVFAVGFVDPYDTKKSSVIIRSRQLDATQFSVTPICDTTSAPAAISFEANVNGGVLVARDDLPNGLAYSKPFEPEHVPFVNFLTVGNESDAILALAPIGDAMIVFKQDGIFKITGSAPDGWNVDLLEQNTRIVRGECVSVMDGIAFALTDRGVVAVTSAGSQNISNGKIGREIEANVQRIFQTSQTGAWVATWSFKGVVLVALPTVSSDYATYLYAFHTGTGAWTRWTHTAYCGVESALTYFIIARGGAYWELRRTPDFYSSFRGYDASWSVSTWSVVSTTITILDANMPSGWAPKVGDWASTVGGDGLIYRRITGVVDDAGFWTITIDTAFGVASVAGTVYEGIISKIRWQGHHVGGGETARLRTHHVQMDWSAYAGSVGGSAARLVLGAQTDVTPTNTTVTTTRARSAAIVDVRVAPSREVSRATHILPYLETDDIGLEWRCLGVVLDLEDVSEKTSR